MSMQKQINSGQYTLQAISIFLYLLYLLYLHYLLK